MTSARTSVRNTGARFAALGSLGLLVLACGGEKQAESAPAPSEAKPVEAAKAAEPTANAAAAELGPAISEASFDLALAAAGPYKSGELGRVVLSLKPKGIYHVNMEYPIAIDLEPSAGLSLPKNKLEQADASKFEAEQAQFDIPLTPSAAGDQKLVADVDFAVCTEETCVPDRRKLAIALPVQ